MIFRPYYQFESGCASYLFGCATYGSCVVVDPHEDFLDAYLDAAAKEEMRVTYVIDTHLHADHRSGARVLAERTGAKYGLHASAQVAFPFEPLADGMRLDLGNTQIDVLHTPGHTPEGISLVVTDLRRGPEPWFVCTGDTLFVNAVGRPDLPGDEARNAATLYDSLHAKLLALPSELEVYPAHFSGSACGAGMSGKPSTTLAFERRFNAFLAMSREEFVAALGDAAPPKPAAMAATLAYNRGLAATAGP